MVKQYTVLWYPEAVRTFQNIFQWYKDNLGQKSANKFRQNISKTVSLIEGNPFMGKIDADWRHKRKEFRSLLSFPHYRIIYFVEESTVYISYIWDNRMNPNKIDGYP